MKKRNRKLLILGYALYVYLLIKIILFKYGAVDVQVLWRQLQSVLEEPGMIQNRLAFANFTPFVSINRNLDRLSQPNDFMNLFGNIALFIPQGIFVRLSGKGSFLAAFIFSLAWSAALECTQILLAMGSFDVDDLILNVFGGLIGYAICRIFPQPVVLQKKS